MLLFTCLAWRSSVGLRRALEALYTGFGWLSGATFVGCRTETLVRPGTVLFHWTSQSLDRISLSPDNLMHFRWTSLSFGSAIHKDSIGSAVLLLLYVVQTLVLPGLYYFVRHRRA